MDFEQLTCKEHGFHSLVKEVREYDTRKKFFFFGDLVKSTLVEHLKFDKTDHLLYRFSNFVKTEDVYEYDSNWRLITNKIKSKINSGQYDREFSYDQQGCISVIVDKYCKYKCVNEYDEVGHVVSQKEFSTEDDKLKYVSQYLYDGNGRLIEELEQVVDGVQKMVYEYDRFGKKIKDSCFFRGEAENAQFELVYTSQYKYNGHGDVEEIINSDKDGSSRSCFSYEYDSRGNWVKQVVLVRKDIEQRSETTVRLREIEYF